MPGAGGHSTRVKMPYVEMALGMSPPTSPPVHSSPEGMSTDESPAREYCAAQDVKELMYLTSGSKVTSTPARVPSKSTRSQPAEEDENQGGPESIPEEVRTRQ